MPTASPPSSRRTRCVARRRLLGVSTRDRVTLRKQVAHRHESDDHGGADGEGTDLGPPISEPLISEAH